MSDDRKPGQSDQSNDGQSSDGMSKEEWLRQNPGQAVDPEGEQVDEGMTKEEYLRKQAQSNQGDGSGGASS